MRSDWAIEGAAIRRLMGLTMQKWEKRRLTLLTRKQKMEGTGEAEETEKDKRVLGVH